MRTIERVQAFAKLLGFTDLLFNSPADGDAFIDLANENVILAGTPMFIEWVDSSRGRKIQVSVEETNLDWADFSKYYVDKDGSVNTKPVVYRGVI